MEYKGYRETIIRVLENLWSQDSFLNGLHRIYGTMDDIGQGLSEENLRFCSIDHKRYSKGCKNWFFGLSRSMGWRFEILKIWFHWWNR